MKLALPPTICAQPIEGTQLAPSPNLLWVGKNGDNTYTVINGVIRKGALYGGIVVAVAGIGPAEEDYAVPTIYSVNVGHVDAFTLAYGANINGPVVNVTDLTVNGPNINLPGLPTADPHAPGGLWNDGGTVKVSAG